MTVRRRPEPLLAWLAERHAFITANDILAIKQVHGRIAAEHTAKPVEEWRRRAEAAAEEVRRGLGLAIDSLLQERHLAPAEQAALAQRLAEKSTALLIELGIDTSAASDGQLGAPMVPAPVQHMLRDLTPILPPHRGRDERAEGTLRGSARFDDVARGLVERGAAAPEDAFASATAVVLLELLPHALGVMLAAARAAEAEARMAGRAAAGRRSDRFALLVLGGIARAHEAMFDVPIRPFAAMLPRHGISAAAWVKALVLTLSRNLHRGSVHGDDSRNIADRLDALLHDQPDRDNGAARADRALMELLQKAMGAEAGA